jgi:hypothetical protein
MSKSDIHGIIKKCVELMVNGDFIELERANMNGRLSVEDIRFELSDYPGKLSIPPNESYKEMDIYKVHTGGWRNVNFKLWYDNQESDLTLSVRVKQTSGDPELQIQDIHVL